MAKLTSKNLTLEIRIAGVQTGGFGINFPGEIESSLDDIWIHYDVLFLWNNKPILTSRILDGRAVDKKAFFADEYQGIYLVDTLRRVIETDEPDYWTSAEPSITMGIYPETYFPFLVDPFVMQRYIMAENEPWFKDRTIYGSGGEAVEPIGIPYRFVYKRDFDRIKGDITIVTLLDAGFFKDGEPDEARQGISLHLVVKRRALKKFADDLEEEYNEFRRQKGLPEA